MIARRPSYIIFTASVRANISFLTTHTEYAEAHRSISPPIDHKRLVAVKRYERYHEHKKSYQTAKILLRQQSAFPFLLSAQQLVQNLVVSIKGCNGNPSMFSIIDSIINL